MNDELKSLIRAYADGTIDESQFQKLDNILKSDSDTRQVYLHELNLISALEDIAIAEGAGVTQPSIVTTDQNKTTTRFGKATSRWQLVATAVVLALMISGVSWMLRGPKTIGSLSELHGSMRWTGNNGEVVRDLAVGERLSGGTIELLTADSWVVFRFNDGSTVTLSGESELTISEQNRKELHLRRGSLFAEVMPQPKHSPMAVLTPSANLEVLGTQFNLQTEEAKSRLRVNEGLVSLQRVPDGEVIDVTASHEVITELGDTSKLQLVPVVTEAETWRSNLKSDVVHGKWIPKLWSLGQRLKDAVAQGGMTETDAIAAYKKAANLSDEGGVWATPSSVGTLVVLSASPSPGAKLQLGPRSVFRIRGRITSTADLEIGVSLVRPGSGFAGKFSTTLRDDQRQGDDGTFYIELPVDAFRALKSTTTFDKTAVGLELADIWFLVRDANTKLEIINVELIEAEQ